MPSPIVSNLPASATVEAHLEAVVGRRNQDGVAPNRTAEASVTSSADGVATFTDLPVGRYLAYYVDGSASRYVQFQSHD